MKKIYKTILFSLIIIGSGYSILKFTPLKKEEQTENKEYVKTQENTNENNNMNSNKFINEKDIPEENKIYISSSAMFFKDPTIENLYEMADLVVKASLKEELNVAVVDDKIRTTTEFNINKIIKNNQKINLEKSIVTSRLGGTLKINDYLKEASLDIKKKFSNMSDMEKEKYFIVQQAGNLRLEKNTQYLLFLNIRDQNIVINSSFYGIRKIENHKIYDYDSEQYIDTFIDVS